METIEDYKKKIVALPSSDYIRIKTTPYESDNASIEQAKAVSNAVQSDSNFTGSNAI